MLPRFRSHSVPPTALLLLLFAAAARAAQPSAPVTLPPPAASTPSAIDVTVSANAPDPVEAVGKTVFAAPDVSRQTTARLDVNELARTLNNVQFDATRGALSEDTVLNLRPALLSIAGGRTYENNFVVEGLSTTSITDTTNTNVHAYDSVVGHPQTTFVSPALLGALTVFESDVPARYSGFTGGVVKADLRDPTGAWGGGAGYARASSSWIQYLTAPEHTGATMPEKPRFEREVLDLYLDVPISTRLSGLLGWTRQWAVLENTQRLAAYGRSTRAETTTDNITAKFVYTFAPETKLRFTSLWSPYRQENTEQDLKLQHNDSWLNKLELSRQVGGTEFLAYAALQLADNSREQAPNLYTYKNFGAGDQVDWVADTAATGARGGNGDMTSTQRDLPIGAEYSLPLTATGRLSVGADYTFTRARKQRPLTNHAYRHQSTSSVVKDATVTSALGRDDPTVLEGEQALNYRLTYLAFDANVQLQAADAWAQWTDQGRVFGLPWSYRAGLRYDTNDFLRNHDVAPRFTAQIEPFRWLKLHAGFNRYYTHAMLAYQLQEKYPDTYAHTRTYTLVNGRKVYGDAWTLSLHSRPANYAQAGLNTPYSDEFSYGLTFDLARLGTLRVAFLRRQNRDEFVRDEGTRLTYVNEKTGATSTYTKYTVSNAGFTDYRSTSLEWKKHWRHHEFRAGATFSDTETSTPEANYFSENYDSEALNELVYYRGALVTRRQATLDRANFARPTYVNLAWSSSWFQDRLAVDVLGRWNTAYERVDDSGSTIVVGGQRYDRYDNVHVPAGIINDLSLRWRAVETHRGTLTVELKVGNLLNRLPYSEGASTTTPYQEGRSFWLRTSYAF
ncbi:hypothetical protein [Opitutus sp. ER46]|uniref:hypothetical protein n=1 Tax=Opitutus sp. ER46 TaxID=2161864 RepID=UPI000D31054C|nr:hypothetical protein [Opitutus sp. ER46]PTX96519.1 hypothetical protein DB354_07635 [Opitutus sp. ER46]